MAIPGSPDVGCLAAFAPSSGMAVPAENPDAIGIATVRFGALSSEIVDEIGVSDLVFSNVEVWVPALFSRLAIEQRDGATITAD